MSSITVGNLIINNVLGTFTGITCNNMVATSATCTNLSTDNCTTSNLQITNSFSVPTINITNLTSTNLVTTNSSTLTNLFVSSASVKSTSTALYLVPVPVFYNVTGQTAPATIATVTVPAFDTMYRISLVIHITAYTSGSGWIFITYTGASGQVYTSTGIYGTSQNLAFNSNGFGGNTGKETTCYVASYLCKASTTMTITTGGSFTMTYQAKCVVQQLTFA